MKYLASTILIIIGHHLRNRGVYNKNTLAFFFRAYQLNNNVSVLLAYLRFRRDLGYALNRRLAAQLLACFHALPSKKLRQAANLLIECGFESQLVSSVDASMLSPLAAQSPPIAALGLDGSSFVQSSQALSNLYQKQLTWRDEFAKYLRQRSDSICVVGNAGSIIGSGHGKQIDSHEVVVRFNCYSSDFSNSGDIGEKVTVWCCAPNCTQLFLDKDSKLDWSVLSGPDVRYQMTEWQYVALFVQQGGRVLTAPLPIWRGLVRLLHAPPSAGVLLLAWIIEIRGNAEGLVVTGFDSGISTKQYHQALPGHKAAQRHNWQGESGILRKWQKQGLVVLGQSL